MNCWHMMWVHTFEGYPVHLQRLERSLGNLQALSNKMIAISKKMWRQMQVQSQLLWCCLQCTLSVLVDMTLRSIEMLCTVVLGLP